MLICNFIKPVTVRFVTRRSVSFQLFFKSNMGNKPICNYFRSEVAKRRIHGLYITFEVMSQFMRQDYFFIIIRAIVKLFFPEQYGSCGIKSNVF